MRERARTRLDALLMLASPSAVGQLGSGKGRADPVRDLPESL